jgi:hypothetical protein
MMDEDVLAAFNGKEAEALLIAEPLHGAGETLLTHCWRTPVFYLLLIQKFATKRRRFHNEAKTPSDLKVGRRF